MIKFENTEVRGFTHALRGMRNPLDSWAKSDTVILGDEGRGGMWIGENDTDLAKRLISAGPEHAKFLRQIICWTDIVAPRFWWIEFDTYRLGVEKNSCSTMHTVMRKAITPEDFSFDHSSAVVVDGVVEGLNQLRELYLEVDDPEEKKRIWRTFIEHLPQSFNQRRTVMMSYQALRNMIRQRRGHKLTEWADFIAWAETLPNSWMLTEGR